MLISAVSIPYAMKESAEFARVNPLASSGRVNQRFNLSANPNWVCVWLNADRHVTPVFRKDKLEKVSVTDDYVFETAAVDVASL